ncbi:MAG: hypothetical protein V8Q17_11130 [Acutalibacteraceae bacterium]
MLMNRTMPEALRLQTMNLTEHSALMLANVSGNFLIEDCEFINSVYSVVNGPTSGSGSEATTITTSSASNNHIVVKNKYA